MFLNLNQVNIIELLKITTTQPNYNASFKNYVILA